MPCPCRFKPRNDQVSIVCEAGWAPGAGWKGAEKLTYTGIQSLGLPALARSHTNYTTWSTNFANYNQNFLFITTVNLKHYILGTSRKYLNTYTYMQVLHMYIHTQQVMSHTLVAFSWDMCFSSQRLALRARSKLPPEIIPDFW
jgi:hypothetical protein